MLAPDKDLAQQILVNFTSSYQSILLASISLRGANVFPPTPEPDWMPDLIKNLQNAQINANQFMMVEGPAAVAQIPQTFISYGTRMQVIANKFSSTLTKEELLTDLFFLKRHMDEIPATVKSLQDSMNLVATNFKLYKNFIETGIAKAQAEIGTDQAIIKELTDKMNALYLSIATETAKASGGMITILTSGISMSFATIGIAFAIAIGGNPLFAVIGVAIALGVFIFGAVNAAINDAKIVEQLGEIKTLSDSLLKENQSLGALQALLPILQGVDNSLNSIQASVDMSGLWNTENQKVQDLITLLQNYEGSNFMSIPDVASIPQAAVVWSDIIVWATNIQRSVSGSSFLGKVDVKAAA